MWDLNPRPQLQQLLCYDHHLKSIIFAISSSVNAFNVVVLVLPRLPTLSPNSIAASSLGVSKIPIPSYLPNVQYTVNLQPNFSASLFSASARLLVSLTFLIPWSVNRINMI